jgi:ABC-2 type transport system ATP-binding protein
MPMEPLLEVRNLVKDYGGLRAVNGISFAIEAGTCFGLLGPNGAGKTTTIEVIEGIASPTSGDILYKGTPRGAEFTEAVGIQFQHTALLNFLTVRETLEVFASLYPHAEEISTLIRQCRLEEFVNQYNDRISGGQRQRFLLALALVNQPELVFLDEPSTGLDPQARRNLWGIVEKLKEDGKTIVLTTHYMEEASQLCDRIAIMDHGDVIAHGSPQGLIDRYRRGITVVLPRSSVDASVSLDASQMREFSDRIEIQAGDINTCLEHLLSRNIDLTEMTVRSPNLEDVFIELTGRHLRE